MNWEDLTGAVVDGRFRLCAITCVGGEQAEFVADRVDTSGGRLLTLTLLAAAGKEFTEIREKLSRAAQLRHPGLLEIAGTGSWRTPSHEELLYLACQTPEETLADVCRSAPLGTEAVLAMLADLLDGLEFLHGRGLVYRGLEPQTIVRSGGGWKLGDYGRLHRAGVPDPQIGSFLNGSRYTPPEAYSGIVLPAWDVWDLGTIVLEALTGRPDEGVAPPAPFDAVVRGCLYLSPDARLSIGDLRGILGLAARETEPPAAETASTAPDERWEPAPVGDRPTRWNSRWIVPAGLAALAGFGVLLGAFHTRPAQPPATTPPPKRVEQPAPVIHRPAPPAAPQETAGEIGLADYTSAGRHGRRTASGEPFSSTGLTAAHRTFPLGSRVRVTNLKNGRTVEVRINDRGLHRRGYVIRVSRKAAEQLGFAGAGSAKVRLDLLD